MKSTDTFLQELEKKLQTLAFAPKVANVGFVEEAGAGVAVLSGLSKLAMGELVKFDDGVLGLCFNLDEDSVSLILLGEYSSVRFGNRAEKTGKFLTVGVSRQLIGRVINPLGVPLDGRGAYKTDAFMPLERIAPGVVARKSVDTPLLTGIKAIDAMTPIGRGQRELIIGDRATGKTSIALDTIINQGQKAKRRQVICIYVAIGQKQGAVAQIVAGLKSHKAAAFTIVVSATASENASLQYLAPFAGCAIAEYFAQKGEDVLIIYDDLTKHAWAYRQLSLILKRPAGREAYPGDIFYLHSRLLERAVRFNEKAGGGSITALPIIETQAGDVAAYIPTNIISITDGQIYLESDLFNAGIRPAMNVGISVSRVGGAAQTQIMRKVAGPLRLDLAQYRELASFVQFGSDLDKATQARLDRGARMTEILKQQNFSPMQASHEIVILWAVTEGLLDNIPVSACRRFEEELLGHLEIEKKLLDKIDKEEKLTDEIIKGLEREITKFKKRFTV